MKFERDAAKAIANHNKHGVSFDEGATVFLDQLALSGPDPDHSLGESRYITFGMSSLGRHLPYPIHIVRAEFASLAQGASLARKGNFMKKVKDEMRAEYKRSDFTSLERGKFHKEAVKGTAIALLDPAIAKAFPNSEAVNEALLGLLMLTEQTARITGRSKRTPRKRATV